MLFIDEMRGGVSQSQMFHGGNPICGLLDVATTASNGPFFYVSSAVSTDPPAPTKRTEAAPVRKSYRWLSGSPAQKGRRVKGRVPRRQVNAASLNNALESLAPVPLHPLLTRFQVARRAKVAK